MNFMLISRNQSVPSSGVSTAYLRIDHWNDYSFVTMFQLSLHDELGKYHNLGNVKIGFKNQDTSISTYSTLEPSFTSLQDSYFSLGMELDYYVKAGIDLTKTTSESLLSGLKDIVYDDNCLRSALEEQVFRTSLLRGVSLATVKGQFRRVLSGGVPLTNFSFSFKRPQTEKIAGVELPFGVKAESKPSTNIHAFIGRNGVGKTTILNGMIASVTRPAPEIGAFYNDDPSMDTGPIDSDYFSSLVSVSFSAFDPFVPPEEQSNPALGTCYYYIGLKETGQASVVSLKSIAMLHAEFADGLAICMSQAKKKFRWIKAIRTLESDENFGEMNLTLLMQFSQEALRTNALALINRMSSGHAVVLLTITKLVATVEEKTLVLIDEPESHLHPPLLSAFIRALSELLHDRNGVAIIATHSPVVLQEIPKSCVWKINRSRLSISRNRPEIETFGENVGTLTREVFGLEVVKSGFHKVLEATVADGGTFQELIESYNGQLGFEAQAILRSMILNRDMDVNR